MKILYISAEYCPAEIAITIRSRFNVAALLQDGHEVTVLTSGETRSGPDSEPVVGVGKTLADNSASLKRRLSSEVMLGFAFARYLVANRNSFDKVVITSPPFFALLTVSLFLWISGLPYVVDVRDRYPYTLFSLSLISPRSFMGRILSSLERRVYTHAQAVVTVTAPLQEAIATDTGLDIQLVRNGYDEKTFMPQITENSADEPVRIIQHGLFGRLVDDANIVKIANYCAEHALAHEFLLVGYGKKLDDIAERGLPNVRVLAKQSQEIISSLLQDSDIGMASMVENDNTLVAIPVKVFEYIGAGLPIVHLPVGVTGREIQERNLGFTCDNEDWETAAQWLVEMINSPELREQYSKNVCRVRHQYSRQTQSKRFAEILGALPREIDIFKL